MMEDQDELSKTPREAYLEQENKNLKRELNRLKMQLENSFSDVSVGTLPTLNVPPLDEIRLIKHDLITFDKTCRFGVPHVAVREKGRFPHSIAYGYYLPSNLNLKGTDHYQILAESHRDFIHRIAHEIDIGKI